jgi:hypothetical protein
MVWGTMGPFPTDTGYAFSKSFGKALSETDFPKLTGQTLDFEMVPESA